MSLRQSWQEFAALAAIVLVAAFLRLYRLDQVPPGLHYDEAFNAVSAERVISGAERPIFFTEDNAQDPLVIYLAAVSFSLFGASPWSLRLVSALAGTLNVAALYLLARVFFRRPWSAALAAFVLSILYWHLNFSRLGMEPILASLMATLTLAIFWKAQREGSASPGKLWAAAGALLGVNLYTYLAGYFVPILVGLGVALDSLVDRGYWTRNRRGLAIMALTAVLVFSPLGLYFVGHPNDLVTRPSQVTVGVFDGTTLAQNAAKVAGMFFFAGDSNPRSNLPGRPALDPFLAVGFLAGIGAALWRIRKPESRWLLLWLVVMALPSVLTDFPPHFGRDIGLPPAIALTVAWGFTTIWPAVAHRPAAWLRPAAALVLVVGLGFSFVSTVRDYFVVWAGDPGLFESFDVGYLSLAKALRDRPADETAYLTPVDQSNYTIAFGLGGRPAQSFDGRSALVLPAPGQAATYAIVTREDTRSLARLAELYPEGHTVASLRDLTGAPYAALFESAGARQITPQHRAAARFGDAAELVGWDAARHAQSMTVTLYWECLAATTQDYTVFVHLVGGMNPKTASPVWSQADSRPDRGSYPTTSWRPGQMILDDYELALPADLPPGQYQIEVGMYTLKTGARVRVTDANGAPMENNRVLLESYSQP